MGRICRRGRDFPEGSMTMQIYADVLSTPVQIVGTHQGSASGSALFGAMAAGRETAVFPFWRLPKGWESAETQCTIRFRNTLPFMTRLYGEYKQLHDYFGRGGSNVMKRLKALSRNRNRSNKIFSRDQWIGQKGAARMRLGALEGTYRKETDALIRGTGAGR